MDGRSLVNLRDLGGLPLVDGGRTRRGVLYRSDAPHADDVLPSDVEWPPTTVIDLRSPHEVREQAYHWPAGTTVLRLPLHSAAAPDRAPRVVDFGALYLALLETVPHRIVATLAHVVAAPGPVLVHCVAGKDRTGIVVAALLLAAGVEPSAVVEDYQATERNLPALVRRWEALGVVTFGGGPVPEGWMLAPDGVISPVVERITGWAGGARGWWLAHGADERDLDRWRDKLRSPADQEAYPVEPPVGSDPSPETHASPERDSGPRRPGSAGSAEW